MTEQIGKIMDLIYIMSKKSEFLLKNAPRFATLRINYKFNIHTLHTYHIHCKMFKTKKLANK